MATFFGVIAFLGSGFGALMLFVGLSTAKGAPQEAAAAAAACALAIIPYVIFRVIQLDSERQRKTNYRTQVLEHLQAIRESLEETKAPRS